MKAAVLVKAGADFRMELEELQMPKPKRGEVLIRTKASEHNQANSSTKQPPDCRKLVPTLVGSLSLSFLL